MMSFPLIAASKRVEALMSQYPLIGGYVDRLQKDEGYQRAVKKVEEIEGTFEVI